VKLLQISENLRYISFSFSIDVGKPENLHSLVNGIKNSYQFSQAIIDSFFIA
jgi:hypothetical protein